MDPYRENPAVVRYVKAWLITHYTNCVLPFGGTQFV